MEHGEKSALMLEKRGRNEMGKKRNTRVYRLKKGNKILKIGTTDNPNERIKQHKKDGKKFTHVEIDKYPRTLESALKKEKMEIQRYKKNHNGKRPPYNKIDR